MEPTKAEKQIAIDAAKKIKRIYPVMSVTKEGGFRQACRVILREGHIKDFDDEYEAALYVLKQELMR